MGDAEELPHAVAAVAAVIVDALRRDDRLLGRGRASLSTTKK